jgi:phytoene synthase
VTEYDLRGQLRSVAPLVRAEGKLIRPLVAYAAAGDAVDDRFRLAVAAIQLAHEASLVHDDIIDNAATRRGAPAFHVQQGIGAAIVQGDRLLAAGYACAAATGSVAFMRAYARAIELTIDGEVTQARSAGHVLTRAAYDEIITLKSGELIGCALAARALLDDAPHAAALYELGRRLGALYQRIDDLMDYLPHRASAKPALSDLRQGRWTWPLEHLHVTFDADLASLPDYRAIGTCIGVIEQEVLALRPAIDPWPVITVMVDEWVEQLRSVAFTSWLERRTGDASNAGFFAHHSRSFSFAARLLPAEFRPTVQAIYAFCRVTDDLVDEPDDAPLPPLHLLERWEALARAAQRGTRTGVRVIDEALYNAPTFEYAAQLIEGMRMDARNVRYGSMRELHVYTHRVAGVVGQWLIAAHGVRDPWLLERAARLGHAMQLTNILRDVGEDWRRGRFYLPADRMRAHGVTFSDIEWLAAAGHVSPAYRALIDDMLMEADAAYADAYEAIPRLPRALQRGMYAAALIYHALHESLRANGYNNGTRRATTTWLTKVRRAIPALTMAIVLCAMHVPAHAQLREAWVAAAADEARMKDAWRELAAFFGDSVTASAYRGALELLEARYGTWPPGRLKHARAGFALLDDAVNAAPQNLEVRYLRLMSYYYLPGFFGKREEVRADLDAVRALLPIARDTIPAAARADIERFLAGAR